MSGMMRRASDRTPANDLRSDSLPIPTGSRPLRIDGKSVARRAVREAMAATTLSQKAMAEHAGISESMLSDALRDDGPRNLETGWLIAQGDVFLIAYWDSVTRQLGLTADAKREANAAIIGELVRRLVAGAA